MKGKPLFESTANEHALQMLEGFRFQPDFVDRGAEAVLLDHIRELPFREFEFHGYLGKRQIVSFGWRYDYTGRGGLQPAAEIPEFLLGLRNLAASFAKLEPSSLQQVVESLTRLEGCPRSLLALPAGAKGLTKSSTNYRLHNKLIQSAWVLILGAGVSGEDPI